MFGLENIKEKKKVKEKLFSHICLYYEKIERKSYIIKRNYKFIYILN